MKALIQTILYKPLYNILVFLAWLVPGHSVGWAIILLTLLLKLVLLPSSLKAARSQVKIQALAPKINELRKNIKDPAEQSKALFALYKEEGVSQFGSCLPLLIQLPILYGLYWVFRTVVQHGLNPAMLYSFTPHPETLNSYFLGLNLLQPSGWILPIIAGVSQYFLSVLSLPKTPAGSGDPKDPTQAMLKQMNYIFPVMTIFFARVFPTGITLYWIFSTILGIIQQRYINITIRDKILAEMESHPAETNKAAAAVLAEELGKPVLSSELQDASETTAKPAAKRDYLTRLMNKRLDKQEKKTGVNITIRKKGEK